MREIRIIQVKAGKGANLPVLYASAGTIPVRRASKDDVQRSL
jgi:hypothetical protein